MIRRLLKTGIASAAHWTGTDNLFAPRTGTRHLPLVIGYHRVVEDFRASAARDIAPMLISTRTLERQLDWIGRRFDFVTLDDLVACLEGTRRFPRPVMAITFDDGYRDVYHHGFPIFQRKGIPAAVFVVTDLVGSTRLQIYDELYLLLVGSLARWRDPQRLAPLLHDLGVPAAVSDAAGRAAAESPFRALRVLLETLSQADLRQVADALRAETEIPASATETLYALNWEMLREMSRQGITVGSHTRTHALLTHETPQKVFDETAGSRQLAEQQLGTAVRHFAYPDGRFNATVVKAVAAAGYRSAYTTCQHRDPGYPQLTIPRRILWENSCVDVTGNFSPAVMSCQIHGVFDSVRQCRQDHSSQLGRSLSPETWEGSRCAGGVSESRG